MDTLQRLANGHSIQQLIHHLRQQICLDPLIDKPRTTLTVATALGHVFDQFLCVTEGQLALKQARPQTLKFVLDQLVQHHARYRVVRDHSHTGQQCRFEMSSQHRPNSGVQHLDIRSLSVGAKLSDTLAAQIGSHQDQSVAKIDFTPFAVIGYAFVEHLVKQVQDIRVGLLYLVEQHHRVGLLSHGLRQYAALSIADVAGRCSDQSGQGMFLLVLRHIDRGDKPLTAVQQVSQGVGRFCLANAAGAHQQEYTYGSIRPVHAGRDGAQAAIQSLHGALLTEDAAAQILGKVQDLRAVFTGQLFRWNTSPGTDHLCHQPWAHFKAGQALFVLYRLQRLMVFGKQPLKDFNVFAAVKGFDPLLT